MSRYRYDSLTVCHNDVFPLSCDPKTGFFQAFHRDQMIDTRNLRHLYRDLDFANICVYQLLLNYVEIFFDRIFDIT